jgi:hypothetical protein
LVSDYRGADGIEAGVEARMRRQEILHDPKHRLEFIVTEAGLRWRPGLYRCRQRSWPTSPRP